MRAAGPCALFILEENAFRESTENFSGSVTEESHASCICCT